MVAKGGATILIGLCLMTLTMTKVRADSSQSTRTKPQVLLMMSSHAAMPKGDLLELLAVNQPFELIIFNTKGKSEEEVDQAWSTSSLILLDGINPALSKFIFGKYQPRIKAFPSVAVVSLGDLDNPQMNQGLSERQRKTVGKYFKNAGRTNYGNMMNYIAGSVLNISEVQAEAPINVPNVGLYHYAYNGQVTADADQFFSFLNAKDNQPVIAIGMHRSSIDYEQHQIVDALIKGLEAKGAKALGFFFEGNDEALNYTDLLMHPELPESGSSNPKQARVDLIINYRSLHYVEKRRQEFEKLGVPVLHALNYTEGTQADFEADHAGISPSLTVFFLVMPEDTGSADPTIIAANAQQQTKQVSGQKLKEQKKVEPIETDHTPIYLLSMLVLFGAVSQWLERVPKNQAHYEVQSRPALDKAA